LRIHAEGLCRFDGRQSITQTIRVGIGI